MSPHLPEFLNGDRLNNDMFPHLSEFLDGDRLNNDMFPHLPEFLDGDLAISILIEDTERRPAEILTVPFIFFCFAM
jgi:hypothetical protein